MKGINTHGRMLVVNGRVSGVHKALVAAAQTCRAGNDTMLTDEGGFIWSKHSHIGREMRSYLQHLRHKYGDSELTPIYIENGVYVMDYYMFNHRDVSGVDNQQSLSGFRRPERQRL